MEKFQKIFKIQRRKHNVGRCMLKITVTEYAHFNVNINKKHGFFLSFKLLKFFFKLQLNIEKKMNNVKDGGIVTERKNVTKHGSLRREFIRFRPKKGELISGFFGIFRGNSTKGFKLPMILIYCIFSVILKKVMLERKTIYFPSQS